MSHCWTREFYIYIYIYTHTHTHIHTYTHTYIYEMLEETCANWIGIRGF